MITFRIHHTVTETDFGDRHSWQSSALETAHDDEAIVRRMTGEVVEALAKAGVTAVVVESTSRTPYPSEW